MCSCRYLTVEYTHYVVRWWLTRCFTEVFTWSFALVAHCGRGTGYVLSSGTEHPLVPCCVPGSQGLLTPNCPPAILP